jgi:ferredoxin-NADP reductase/ferredoxin
MLDGKSGLAVTSPPPAWRGFKPMTVAAIEHESDSVISVRFEDTGAALPGQYLTLRIGSLLRNYSLCGPPAAYRIAVKREGIASSYLHTKLAVGDQLEVAAPRGTFLLDDTQAPVLLISAGIGVTPVLAMLHALAHEHSEREIWWLHGTRERAFVTEAQTLLATLPNVRAHVYYSPDHLTPAVLAELDPPRDAEAYLCGPAAFMDEISAGLAAIGLEAAHIHTEPFGPAAGLTPGIAATPTRAPHLPPGEPGSGPTVEFARSNLAIPWSDGYASLLELAEACDVPVRWSCRTGVCHNCETTLIAGRLAYDPDPVEPPADGSALICCSRPREDVVLDLWARPPCPATPDGSSRSATASSRSRSRS